MGQAVRLDDLKSVRRALSKSQSQMASLLGVSIRAVQSYEQGWRPLPPHVQKMAGLILWLDHRKDNPGAKPCWEIKKCPPERRAKCPAGQLAAGELCWLVTGDFWRGDMQKSWEAKLAECAQCPVMSAWLKA